MNFYFEHCVLLYINVFIISGGKLIHFHKHDAEKMAAIVLVLKMLRSEVRPDHDNN